MADEQDDFELGGRLAWFMVGAMVGAAVALLYAPKSGRDTRKIISSKAQESREAVSETSKEVMERGRDIYNRGKQVLDDAADLFERGRKLVRG